MTRDLKSAYRLNEPMTLDERAEAQREICAEYRWQVYGSGQAGQGDVVGPPPCPSPIDALGQSQPGSARSANCRSAEPD